jgi:hypothetical protein
MADETVDKLEDLRKKYHKLLTLAAKLRHHQIRHYKYKTSVDFDKSVYYGRQVDHFLNKEISQSEKQELFK